MDETVYRVCNPKSAGIKPYICLPRTEYRRGGIVPVIWSDGTTGNAKMIGYIGTASYFVAFVKPVAEDVDPEKFVSEIEDWLKSQTGEV